MTDSFAVALEDEIEVAKNDTKIDTWDDYATGFKEGYLFALEWAQKTYEKNI